MNPTGGGGGGWVKPNKPSTPPTPQVKTTPKTPPPKPPKPAAWKPAVKTTPPAQLITPVNQATKPAIGAKRNAVPCPLKKHFVKVKLVFQDDQTPVPAADCQILQGDSVIDGGPLGNGELGTATVLDPGSYQVTFPEIDAAEWSVG